jgi:hypothetical protein
MNDEELRAMVRESIARQLGSPSTAAPLKRGATYDADGATYASRHAAFVRLPLLSGGDDDGACLIEPTVRCNHCGYCQSFGH